MGGQGRPRSLLRTAAARWIAAALASALAGGAAARDLTPPPRPGDGVRGIVALRAAVALPAGDARAGVPLGDLVSGALPVGVELAARGGATTFGLAFEWGRAFVARCPAGAACSGSVVRAGIELLHRFSPEARASTWMGGGLGWEGTEVSVGGRTTRVDSFELLNLQAGRDVAVGGSVTVGPFVAATLAQGMQQDGADIERKSPHFFFQLGVRVELGL